MLINQETINKYTGGITNPNTRKTYRLSLKKFHSYLQDNNIHDINQKNLNQVIHDYKAYLNNKNLKAITINQHLIILKTFINEYTQLSYDKDLKLIKIPRKKPHYLTTQQIQTALNYTEDKTDELIIKLLTSTGLRIHEALNITKNELENTDEKENAIITIIGKNTKTRLIVIPGKLTRQLKRYSQDHKKYIFESDRKESKPLTSRSIQRRFQKLATRIDKKENTTIYSENLKPHNLRHSFAIQALKNNEINYVKEFLGHENIATTQIYTNLKEKDVMERFKKLENNLI
jgi:integrase/recombinase XerD